MTELSEGDGRPLNYLNGSHAYGPVTVGSGTVVGHGVVFGYPDVIRIRRHQLEDPSIDDAASIPNVAATSIGTGCIIGSHVVVYEGAAVGDRVSVDDFCRIGPRARIGAGCRVIYGADVRHDAVIGDDCVIGGFVCDRAEVAAECVVLGKLVHKLDRPDLPWGVVEQSPILHTHVVVGVGALVVGGIEIGANSYVAAGAVVTKDVPPRHLVIGRNELLPRERWTGSFADSPFWTWGDDAPPDGD